MKKTFAVVLCIVLAALFSGCGQKESPQETTNPSSSAGRSSSAQEEAQHSTTAATQAPTQGTQPRQPETPDTGPEVEQSATEQVEDMENKTDLTGSWAPAFGESVASGAAANLQEIYGSGYAYGGSLDLNTDGTFSVSVGIVKDNDAHQGTYRIDGNLVYVSYNNGEEDVFEYLSDYNGGEAIKARQGDYYIYFCR